MTTLKEEIHKEIMFEPEIRYSGAGGGWINPNDELEARLLGLFKKKMLDLNNSGISYSSSADEYSKGHNDHKEQVRNRIEESCK